MYLQSSDSGKPINSLYFLNQSQLSFLLLATKIFLSGTQSVIQTLKSVYYFSSAVMMLMNSVSMKIGFSFVKSQHTGTHVPCSHVVSLK